MRDSFKGKYKSIESSWLKLLLGWLLIKAKYKIMYRIKKENMLI
ncbi:hypothetical protein [Clostridium pasteurianum]|nr:hypothetical protein [Clostridium pasteurianum]